MTIAAVTRTSDPSRISDLPKEISATSRINPLTQGPTFPLPGRLMTDENPQSSAEAYKARMKAIGLSQRDFADFLGFHFTTLTKWWNGGIPIYAMRVLELIERYYVPPTWRGTKSQPEPTVEDARKALNGPVTNTIDEAIRQGWSRQQIAAALRSIADQTDG